MRMQCIPGHLFSFLRPGIEAILQELLVGVIYPITSHYITKLIKLWPFQDATLVTVPYNLLITATTQELLVFLVHRPHNILLCSFFSNTMRSFPSWPRVLALNGCYHTSIFLFVLTRTYVYSRRLAGSSDFNKLFTVHLIGYRCIDLFFYHLFVQIMLCQLDLVWIKEMKGENKEDTKSC